MTSPDSDVTKGPPPLRGYGGSREVLQTVRRGQGFPESRGGVWDGRPVLLR